MSNNAKSSDSPTRVSPQVADRDITTGTLFSAIVHVVILILCLFSVWFLTSYGMPADPAPADVVIMDKGPEPGVEGKQGEPAPDFESEETEDMKVPDLPNGDQKQEEDLAKKLEEIEQADADEFERKIQNLRQQHEQELDDAARQDLKKFQEGTARLKGQTQEILDQLNGNFGKGEQGEGLSESGERARRQLRWIMQVFGVTVDDYAALLDHFGVEIATVAGAGQLKYVGGFAKATPNVRTGSVNEETRIRWRPSDNDVQLEVALLSRAGVSATGAIILFWPHKVEQQLVELERDYLAKNHPNQKVSDIKSTVFRVSTRRGWSFYVVRMEL